jgi:flagellar motor switch protein FliN/FliY
MSQLADIAFLNDLPIELTIELGRTKLTLRALSELCIDDVIDLDRAANEPLDILIGGKLFARGEVVVVDDRVALRVTEVVAGAAERAR